MQGITIISSIIAAVCVFQTAEAELLETLTGNLSIPFENQGSVRNQTVIERKLFPNPIETCAQAYNDGIKTIDKVKTNFGTCFTDKINPDTIKNIQQLIDVLDKLQAATSEAFNKAAKCLNNITNVTPCLINVQREVTADLTPLLQEAIDTATDVLHMSRENISECYQTAIETSQKIIDSLVENGEKCVNSINNLFPF